MVENRVGNAACLGRNHSHIQAGGQLVHKLLNGLGDPQVTRSPSHPLSAVWWGTSAQEWCLGTAPRHLAIGHRWNLPSRCSRGSEFGKDSLRIHSSGQSLHNSASPNLFVCLLSSFCAGESTDPQWKWIYSIKSTSSTFWTFGGVGGTHTF